MSSLTIIQLILVLAGIVVFAIVIGFLFGAVFTFGTYVAEQWINRFRWWRYEKKQAKESKALNKWTYGDEPEKTQKILWK